MSQQVEQVVGAKLFTAWEIMHDRLYMFIGVGQRPYSVLARVHAQIRLRTARTGSDLEQVSN